MLECSLWSDLRESGSVNLDVTLHCRAQIHTQHRLVNADTCPQTHAYSHTHTHSHSPTPMSMPTTYIHMKYSCKLCVTHCAHARYPTAAAQQCCVWRPNTPLLHTSTISKAIFSPSLSQSVHKMRCWQPRASLSKVFCKDAIRHTGELHGCLCTSG